MPLFTLVTEPLQTRHIDKASRHPAGIPAPGTRRPAPGARRPAPSIPPVIDGDRGLKDRHVAIQFFHGCCPGTEAGSGLATFRNDINQIQ